SPDSFADEDDYDDVSLSEPERNHRRLPGEEDLQSQRSKGGTGDNQLLRGTPRVSAGQHLALCCRDKSVVTLYVLVTLSFVMWVALFLLAMVKCISLASLHSPVLQELAETQRGQARMRTRMATYYQELQDITTLICKALPDSRRCSAGWKVFEESCYSFSLESTSWEEAVQICTDQGAHLVIVNTDQEQVSRFSQ
ncbi:CLC4E protein, partial [Crypturellus soui]|nr:CLC4E protein [Crypturellus soui]